MFPLPSNDRERVAFLRASGVLDNDPPERLTQLTRAVAKALDVEIVTISLIDQDKVHFRCQVGIEAESLARGESFCAHALVEPEVLVIEDLEADRRFSDNALVSGPPNVRFYAGAPLKIDDSFRIGTLCAIGLTPKPDPGEDLIATMKSFADVIATELLCGGNQAQWQTSRSETVVRAQNAGYGNPYERARSAFLELVNHELRTPLHAIIGFADYLRASPEADVAERQEYLSYIADGGRLLFHHLNSLVELSALESGEVHLVAEEHRLNDILSLAAPEASFDKGRDRVVLPKAVPDFAAVAYCDRPKLAAAFRNVFEFMLSVSRSDPVVVSVANDGAGSPVIEVEVPARSLVEENCAERLSRSIDEGLDMALGDRRGSGVDFGMVAATKYIELHGGRIRSEITDSRLRILATLPSYRFQPNPRT